MTFPAAALRSLVRLAALGLALAALCGVAGVGIVRSRLGANEQAATALARDEVNQRFREAAAALAARATTIAGARGPIADAKRDPAAARALFDLLDRELSGQQATLAGITVFDTTGTPLAWSGRVSDLPQDRISGPAAIFTVIDALGPRLVRVVPLDTDRATGLRLATVVVEQLVDASVNVSPALADAFTIATTVADVSVRAGGPTAFPPSPSVFSVQTDDGQILAEAEVSLSSLRATRARWIAIVRGVVLTVLAATVLLCVAPLADLWRRPARARSILALTAAIALLLGVARALIWLASRPFVTGPWSDPVSLAPTALLVTAFVWMILDLLERLRVSRRARQAAVAAPAGGAVLCGVVAVGVLWFYLRALHTFAERSDINLLHFSLHPLEVKRLSLAFALVLLHASAIWFAAAILRLPFALRRTPQVRSRLVILAVGAVIITALLLLRRPPVTAMPLAIALGAAAIGALLLGSRRGPLRRASQSARLGALFFALLLPALACYPALGAAAIAAKERLIADTYAPLAERQREDLQLQRLPNALEAIDAMSGLTDFVTGTSEDAAPTTDRAFIVWSQTELATYWTTSAVELYGANGRLVSRFALIPEYGTSTSLATNCSSWELYEETSPVGSTARNILRATRAICDGSRRVGSIVVRAMLDYRALPFVSQESPYIEAFRGSKGPPSESTSGQDIEFAVYGWSRAPLYASGPRVAPLPDEVFERLVAVRDPFWTEINRDGTRLRVYFFSDRGGIYALAYPVITWFGHLVNLGELSFLAAVIYMLLLFGAIAFSAMVSPAPASGRALVREIRASFYRKLFLAFVAATVVPVVFLAVGIRTYFVNQFRAGIEESAVKTATVAQRLVEDYAALQQRGAGSFEQIDDQFMVLVQRAIDQDVNLFTRERLQATSERPLFASHLLPSRTPANVYRSIVLERLPTSVGIEDVGGMPYLLAAAPVRTGGRAGIVSVPQPLRSRETEQQRDELDRRVLSAAMLFVLLGSALGYWMAERIADPINRLTRATRRIARGDLNARIAATSSDELGRLVVDFNQMADDLQRQRADLERTQRLEAWADMARQVAHDIKNPLTPIQLSAEHAQRVNVDRGRPLSPVLDECVSAILSQVRLLRQISAEFSSFATSPTPRPEETAIGEVIHEVLTPYRTALASRVELVEAIESPLPHLSIDRTLFSRALTNVIENALHAMPGGGTLTVRAVEVRTASSRAVEVSVHDTGAGMDAVALARIFEPYFSTKSAGTGLGLTIAKRNIELNGGTITVESEKGVGTIVRMRLPVT